MNAVFAVGRRAAKPRYIACKSPLRYRHLTPQTTISNPQTIWIGNAGQRDLDVTVLFFAGTDPDDFLIKSSTCYGPIPPGESCDVQVAFAPKPSEALRRAGIAYERLIQAEVMQ